MLTSKGTRTCKICNDRASKASRQRRRLKLNAYMNVWRERNRPYVNQLARERRSEKHVWVTEYKSRLACGRCGENHPSCLEFHHRDPKQKDANVSIALAHWSRKRLEVEVAKCDVFCSNCHRKLHYVERDTYVR